MKKAVITVLPAAALSLPMPMAHADGEGHTQRFAEDGIQDAQDFGPARPLPLADMDAAIAIVPALSSYKGAHRPLAHARPRGGHDL
ncbi:hypothetical protein ACIRPX_29280 [Streptomyces sp. NPDC101225]|uniref:hypothetical protein n=1 Tax=Streptomyces sp. NPDC101225 TaxID=3366135 RepID=UPI00381C4E29